MIIFESYFCVDIAIVFEYFVILQQELQLVSDIETKRKPAYTYIHTTIIELSIACSAFVHAHAHCETIERKKPTTDLDHVCSVSLYVCK